MAVGDMTVTHAPLPWRYEFARYDSANGTCHVYLVGANGRKIAAIWGKSEEKIETAQLILDSVNPE